MKSYVLAVMTALCALPVVGMEIKTCADQLILSGPVVGNEYRQVADILAQNRAIKIAVLRNSPGGNADTGYEIGELFREKGIATYVSGYCRSSCSRFFLGGKERFFTDDYPLSGTHVGFHGNYKSDGQMIPTAPARLKRFIRVHSDGKADEALVDRWVNLRNRKGFAYFYHPRAFERPDGSSVLLCQGDEPRNERWKRCEKIIGHDALSMGIITSMELKRSCDAASLRVPAVD